MSPRRTVLILLATAALTTMTLGAAAQDADAPHPSPDAQTLYAHGTGSDEENGFMNTLADDGDDGALGEGDAIAGGSVSWILTLAPALAGAIQLDGEGTIDVTAHIGGSTHVGDVDVTTQITHGETVVAQGESQSHTFTPADAESGGNYQTVTWSLTPETTTLSPGADLVWTITAEGSASAVYLGVGESRGRTNIVLPILSVDLAPPAPDVVVENITQPLPQIDLAFNETTTASYHYNWTADGASYDLTADAELENGTVTFAVVDADDSEVAGGTVNATDGGASNEIRGAAPGNWSIRVDAENATGTFRLDIAPAAPAGIANGTALGGNLTGNATDDGGLGIPGPGAVAVSAGLALAALVAGARRKRV